MRKLIPKSLVVEGHPDFPLLSLISDFLLAQIADRKQLVDELGTILRDSIDQVLQTSRTRRLNYEELEKTEKTYIGTRVEILLRSLFELPRGELLDVKIAGHEVDIKLTTQDNWTIPPEAHNHPCLLAAADEKRALCYLGLVIARPEFLTAGKGNRDAKRSLTTRGFANIFWIVLEEHYPSNFWRTIDDFTAVNILKGRSGNDRVAELFRRVQRRPIIREVINDVARQHDFTRRIRADKGRGVRDTLKLEGILVFSGSYDQAAILALGLPQCGRSEWIAFTPGNADERNTLRLLGY